MRVVKVEGGVIVSMSWTQFAPSDPTWKVVPDSFPGVVGEKISQYRGRVEEAEPLSPSEALATAEAAEEEARTLEGRLVKAAKDFEESVKLSEAASASANVALLARRDAQAAHSLAEVLYKDAAVKARELRRRADRAVECALEADAEAKAEEARRRAVESGKKLYQEMAEDLRKGKGSKDPKDAKKGKEEASKEPGVQKDA